MSDLAVARRLTGGTIQGDTFTNTPGVQHVFTGGDYLTRCHASLYSALHRGLTSRLLSAFPDDPELAELAVPDAADALLRKASAMVVAQLKGQGVINEMGRVPE